ncbi:MAG: bifunctional methylenetetrahydrofolate dehydrogenase/methenyltetrahydrofolate cyclohydrolase FolD [Kiritimatiellia bacterium]|jgi:methylenetetrahydrofolate dehydrogenase (NADP+)/methenyltetrahydrofolate cyclohydrolase
MAQIIDGKQIAASIRADLREKIQNLRQKNIIPGLAVVLVGDDPASKSYVTAKERACEEIGITSFDYRLPSNTQQAALLDLISKLNTNPRIHGILVQLPLPRHIDETAVLLAINPDKDVDGFHPVSVGRMLLGQPTFLPCTPHAVMQLLARSGVTLQGKHAVVIGRSNIVGKPLANLLMRKNQQANATVTVCHTATPDIAKFTRQADVVIAAAGRPNTLTADMVRDGVVVIDVGVNRVPDAAKKSGYRLVGDVDFDAVSRKAAMITPVPGGVGPMTITMLLANTVQAAEQRA